VFPPRSNHQKAGEIITYSLDGNNVLYNLKISLASLLVMLPLGI
jgi:hypothetical protein